MEEADDDEERVETGDWESGGVVVVENGVLCFFFLKRE